MRKRLATVIVLCGVAAGVAAFAWPNQRGSRVARYEYVAEVGQLSVYSIGNGSVVGRFGLPGVAEIRGVDVSAATGMLYVSYGGFPTGITQAGEHGDHRRASCSASRCWRRDPRRQQPNRRLRRGGPLPSSVKSAMTKFGRWSGSATVSCACPDTPGVWPPNNGLSSPNSRGCINRPVSAGVQSGASGFRGGRPNIGRVWQRP